MIKIYLALPKIAKKLFVILIMILTHTVTTPNPFQDLHRTGCSLFCGEDADAEANQLMLKRVLLAYARWNKSIGYCQGFNMLAAIILEVMDKSESHALKVSELLCESHFLFCCVACRPDCHETDDRASDTSETGNDTCTKYELCQCAKGRENESDIFFIRG